MDDGGDWIIVVGSAVNRVCLAVFVQIDGIKTILQRYRMRDCMLPAASVAT